MHLHLTSHGVHGPIRWTPDLENAESNRAIVLTFAAALMVAIVAIAGTGRALLFGDTFHHLAESRMERSADLSPGEAANLVYQVRSYLRFDGGNLMNELAFSYRERMHFREVRDLVRQGQRVLYLAAHAAVAVVFGLLIQATFCGRYALALLGEFLSRLSFLLTVAVGIGLILALDFDRSFYILHGVVFESQNWLLPEDSLTLQLFPRQYFVDLFTAWGAIVMAIAAVSAFGARVLRRSVGGGIVRSRASRHIP